MEPHSDENCIATGDCYRPCHNSFMIHNGECPEGDKYDPADYHYVYTFSGLE